MDIKEKLVILSSSGEFIGKNILMDIPQSIITTNGKYKSGKVVDITVVVDGINKFPTFDLVFFSDSLNLTNKVGETPDLDFDKMKRCAGMVRILSEDFENVGKCSVANLFNLNMTFFGKELHMIPVYQNTIPFKYERETVCVNIGYELGNCA
jgi:hypothetical protein